jgi:hypothetical protein
MTRTITALLFLACTSSVVADGTIEGWVRVHGHQYPVHPVTVRVYDAQSGEQVAGLETENRADGTYEITNVPNGQYKVHYDAHGEAWQYLDELAGNRVCDNAACDIAETGAVIDVEDDTARLNINLKQGVIMRGKVTDDRLRPLEGVTVEFFDEYGEPYCCSRLTDNRGEWERPVYFPATYYVLSRYAEPSPYRPQAYNRRDCSGCDVLETGSRIKIDYYTLIAGIDSRLTKVEPDPEVDVEPVVKHKYSGSWFNPDRDGEGFIVEVLDRPGPYGEGYEIVVFWFTYTQDGKQAWMVGTGAVVGRVAEVEFEITRGASFGAGFHAEDVVRERWGDLRLEFLDCNQAHAQYAGEFGSGQLDLTRLSNIEGLGCEDPDNAEVSDNAINSGAWFNPARDGQGFILEVVGESQLLAYWFTYDTDGSQMWMLGLGEIDGEGRSTISMQRTSGGVFGDEFDPASVELQDWGEVTMEFDACSQASYSWSSAPPYDSGGFNITRLTELKNAGC